MPSPAPAAIADTAPAPPAGAGSAAVTFDAIAEGGVIRVPEAVRAQLGPTFRATVTAAAAAPRADEPAAAADPAPVRPPGVPDYVDPAVAAAHPDWEWASAENLAKIKAALPPPGAPLDLGDLEGTPMGDLMRNPLPTPAGGFLTREEANTDPHRNRGIRATAGGGDD